MKSIDAKELRIRLAEPKPIQLVDVRSAGEYASGHIPQASNIPLEQVQGRLDDIASSGDVVLICQSGRRSEMCFDNFHTLRPNLMVLEGGTDAWQAAGGTVVQTQSSGWSIERQVRLMAGLLILAGTVLSLFADPAWIYLAMFVGAGLTFAGITNICGMAAFFGAMPWNKPKMPTLPTKEAIR